MTIPAPKHKPSEDFTELGNSLLKGDVLKIYYLMVLTGVNPAHANQFLFNLRYSDKRASSVLIRNTLIDSLKQTLLKIVKDPILYQRARALANRNEFNVFEDIKVVLRKQLDETAVLDTLQQIQFLNNDMEFKKKLSTYFTSYVAEEAMTTAAVMVDGGKIVQPIAGLPPEEPPVKQGTGTILTPTILRRNPLRLRSSKKLKEAPR